MKTYKKYNFWVLSAEGSEKERKTFLQTLGLLGNKFNFLKVQARITTPRTQKSGSV